MTQDSTRLLSVAQYNGNEEIGRQISHTSVISAFYWQAGEGFKFPTRVKFESELWKFIDSQQGESVEEKVQWLDGLTPWEYEQFCKVIKETIRYSQEKFQKSIMAPSVLLGDLNLLRHLRYLYGNSLPRIMEIGPGSGQLGSLLSLNGYPYMALEVTQAFYLHQAHFWNQLPKIKLVELAQHDPNSAPPENLKVEQGTMLHVPWFHFRWLTEAKDLGVDTVFCERALCELGVVSLKFYLRLSRNLLLANSSGLPKYFIYSNRGSVKYMRSSYLHCEFIRSGFELIHLDSKITVYAVKDTPEAQGSLTDREFRLKKASHIAKVVLKFPFSLVKSFRTYQSHHDPWMVWRVFEGVDPPVSGSIFFPARRSEASRCIVDGKKNPPKRDFGKQEVSKFVNKLLGGGKHIVGSTPQWLKKD